MRILLIHNFYQYWGGEDSYVSSLKKLLKDNGHEVYLYKKNSKDLKTFWDKIKTGLGMFYNFNTEGELTKIIKKFKPDIAHFHNIYPLIGAIAYRVCKKNNIPIIQHIHNYKLMCPKNSLFRYGKICELCIDKRLPFYSIIFGCYHDSRLASFFYSFSFFVHRIIRTFNLINKFIFPSEFIMNYYLNHLPFIKNKFVYLPNFVGMVDKNNEKKIKEGKYFLYFGRLSEEKGILMLLNIFKQIPDIKLIVIGDGPLKDEVRSFKQFNNIKILGFKKKLVLELYIKNAVAVIVPSLWYEVMPSVILESYRCAVPIIVPNNSNLNKLVIKNKTGFIYKQNDDKDLKNIIKLVNNLYDKNTYRSLWTKETSNLYKKMYRGQIHYPKLIKIYFDIFEKYRYEKNIFFH